MSALSAIETPVAEVQEPRGAVTAESGRHERPIRVIACPVRSIADQDRDVAIGDDQPRSWMVAGTSVGNGSPRLTDTMVDHRGVGISSTRR